MENIAEKTTIQSVEIRVFRELTEEQKRLRKEQDEKNNKAVEFFTTFYGLKSARVIVANVITNYHNKYQKKVDFETAWRELNYEIISEIIYRAVNNLPAKNRRENEYNNMKTEVESFKNNMDVFSSLMLEKVTQVLTMATQ